MIYLDEFLLEKNKYLAGKQLRSNLMNILLILDLICYRYTGLTKDKLF